MHDLQDTAHDLIKSAVPQDTRTSANLSNLSQRGHPPAQWLRDHILCLAQASGSNSRCRCSYDISLAVAPDVHHITNFNFLNVGRQRGDVHRSLDIATSTSMCGASSGYLPLFCCGRWYNAPVEALGTAQFDSIPSFCPQWMYWLLSTPIIYLRRRDIVERKL